MTHVNPRATRCCTGRLFGSQNTGHRGAGHCSRGGGHVDTLRSLSSTRVVSPASILAGRVGALSNTLGVGFSTDVVGHGLRVLRGIGRRVVAADALVGQGLLEESAWSFGDIYVKYSQVSKCLRKETLRHLEPVGREEDKKTSGIDTMPLRDIRHHFDLWATKDLRRVPRSTEFGSMVAADWLLTSVAAEATSRSEDSIMNERGMLSTGGVTNERLNTCQWIAWRQKSATQKVKIDGRVGGWNEGRSRAPPCLRTYLVWVSRSSERGEEKEKQGDKNSAGKYLLPKYSWKE